MAILRHHTVRAAVYALSRAIHLVSSSTEPDRVLAGVLLHPVAAATDVDNMAVVQEPIDEGSGHDLVAQDLTPLLEPFVGREHGVGDARYRKRSQTRILSETGCGDQSSNPPPISEGRPQHLPFFLTRPRDTLRRTSSVLERDPWSLPNHHLHHPANARFDQREALGVDPFILPERIQDHRPRGIDPKPQQRDLMTHTPIPSLQYGSVVGFHGNE